MGCYRDSRMSSSFGGRSGYCGRMRWKPFEIAAMVLGFIVFWPIGLAILFAKFWQRQHGHQGDLFDFAREKAAGFQQTLYSQAGLGGQSAAASGWRSTGNVAFDEWRESELARRVLGDSLFEKFLDNKRLEWERYRAEVHEFELERYLTVL